MALKKVIMRMKDHSIWSLNLKLAHTKETIKTVIYRMTSIADSMDKICVT